jgi:hypothetical protein
MTKTKRITPTKKVKHAAPIAGTPEAASRPERLQFIIGSARVAPSSFRQTERHEAALAELGRTYVPARDNPEAARRPGSSDAFRLPSRSFEGVTYPTHHAVSDA